MILSTIRLLGSCRPFSSSGATGRRISGASVGSVVNAQTLTESVAPKRSSWMMTTGLGLPAYPLPAAADQISARLHVIYADGIDECLVSVRMSASGNGLRLAVCLGCEPRSANVGDPELNGTKTLGSHAFAVAANPL